MVSIAASTRESLLFMAVPVLPVFILLAGIVIFNDEDTTNKIRKIRMLRCNALSVGTANSRDSTAIKCFEQSWELEKELCRRGMVFPASYYDCARAYGKKGEYGRAKEVLDEGQAVLDQFEKSIKSAQQKRVIALERLRIWTISGELLLAQRKYQEAEECFSKAICAVPLREESMVFSTRTVLRLAARGWNKCPQCKQANGDADPVAFQRLKDRLKPDDRGMLDSLLDISAIEPTDFWGGLELQEEAKKLWCEDEHALERITKLIQRFAEQADARPLNKAQRLATASETLKINGHPKEAIQLLNQALQLRSNACLKNQIAISEIQRRMAVGEVMLGNRKAAIKLLRLAKQSADLVLPADMAVRSRAATELALQLSDDNQLDEACALAMLQYERAKRDFINNEDSADGFAKQADLTARLLLLRGKPDDGEWLMFEALSELKRRGDVSLMTGTLLHTLMHWYHQRMEESSETEGNELLRRSATAYKAYHGLQVSERCESKFNRMLNSYAVARLQCAEKRYADAIKTAELELSRQTEEYLFRFRGEFFALELDAGMRSGNLALSKFIFQRLLKCLGDKRQTCEGRQLAYVQESISRYNEWLAKIGSNEKSHQ